MKYILIIIIILTSCSSSKKIQTGISYKIVKIETLDNVYVIYAQNISYPIYETIKIIVKKNNTKKCNSNMIQLNNIYKLNLKSLTSQIEFPKSNIKNISYYGESIALKDKDYIIKDIMITSDIQGLCFYKK